MSVEKLKKKEIILNKPKEMGLLIENPVYKPFRYPWCYDAWLTQQRIHWLPEEVPLGDDVRDWQKNLSQEEKETFKTAFDIDQRWIVELGADRTPHVSQAQSVNVFVPADVHKKELHELHFQAWKKGLKSLYYCRSKSIQRAENINAGSSTDVTKNVYSNKKESDNEENKYEECLSCQ